MSLDEYIAAFKRRRKPIMYTAFAIFVIALLAALLWPPTYKASATILIEEQEIPDDMVRSTITSYANQQIEVIRQRVLTLSNIMEMVRKFNLYDEGELARTPATEIAQKFIDSVALEVLSADVIDPRSGRPTAATIAFTLDFEASDPRKTQSVTNELVNLFLNENLRSRTEQAGSTTEFLRKEANVLAEEVRALETALVAFKAQHQAALPESFQMNMQNLTRYQTQLVSWESRLIELNRRQLDLEAQLASLSPYSPQILSTGEAVLSDVDRLKSLESEYRQLSARYSPNHPDVEKVRREIDALKMNLGNQGGSDDLRKLLASEEAELTALLATYSSDYPEVVLKKENIERIKRQISASSNEQVVVKPDNPAYIMTDNQLQMIRMEKRSLTEQVASLTKQVESLNKAATDAPTVEREYSNLVRNLDVATANYQEIQSKLKTAELAGELESNRKGQRFTLIEPPALPEEPFSPNRTAILLLGTFIAIGAGIGLAVLLELADQSIRSARGLELATGSAPLVMVPYITTPEEDRRNRPGKTLYMTIGLGVAAVIVALLLIHFFYKPLDVMWYVVLNKLGIG